MPQQTPPPQALPVVDFFEQNLTEGDRIAFTSKDNPGLYIGIIQLIGRESSNREQIVVQSGHLLILEGKLIQRSGGKPEHIYFNQVVRRPSLDGA